MQIRIYTDTSVLVGCEDEEFAEHSVRLMEGFVAITRVEETLTLTRAREYHDYAKGGSQFIAEMELGERG